MPLPFLVPRPWRDVDGNQALELNGVCYSVLHWTPGAPRTLGRALGLIHSLTDDWDHRRAPIRWGAETLFTGTNPGLMGADPGQLTNLGSGRRGPGRHPAGSNEAIDIDKLRWD